MLPFKTIACWHNNAWAIANVGWGEADEDLQEAVCNLKVTLITARWGVGGETKEGEKTKGEKKVVNCLQWGRGTAGGVHYLLVVCFLNHKKRMQFFIYNIMNIELQPANYNSKPINQSTFSAFSCGSSPSVVATANQLPPSNLTNYFMPSFIPSIILLSGLLPGLRPATYNFIILLKHFPFFSWGLLGPHSEFHATRCHQHAAPCPLWFYTSLASSPPPPTGP